LDVSREWVRKKASKEKCDPPTALIKDCSRRAYRRRKKGGLKRGVPVKQFHALSNKVSPMLRQERGGERNDRNWEKGRKTFKKGKRGGGACHTQHLKLKKTASNFVQKRSILLPEKIIGCGRTVEKGRHVEFKKGCGGESSEYRTTKVKAEGSREKEALSSPSRKTCPEESEARTGLSEIIWRK